MEQASRVPLITQYLQTLGGYVPQLARVDGSWLVLTCPICSKEYRREISNMWYEMGKGTRYGTTCSKSCMTRRRFLARPETFEASAEKQRGVPRTGPRGRGMLRGPLSQAHRDAVSATLKEMGWAPPIRRGNGTGQTPAEAAIYDVMIALGFEWNCAVSLGGRQPGYPTNYKLDFGHRSLRVGLELDGNSHVLISRQAQDRKKESKLSELGWLVFRLPNSAILSLSGTFTLKDAMTILPAEFWFTIARP